MAQHLLLISDCILLEKHASFPITKPFNWIIDACTHYFFMSINHHWWSEMCLLLQPWHEKSHISTPMPACLFSSTSIICTCGCAPGQLPLPLGLWGLHLGVDSSGISPSLLLLISKVSLTNSFPVFFWMVSNEATSRDWLWSQIDLCLDFSTINN